MKPQLFEGFEYPTTNTEEVLLTLITQGHVSLFDYPMLAGFRTRVSNLVVQYGLKLKTTMSERHNKFGRKYKYAIHKLPEEERENAIILYKKLNRNYPDK